MQLKFGFALLATSLFIQSSHAETNYAEGDWPAYSVGKVSMYMGNRKIGTCDGTLELEISPDRGPEKIIFDMTKCKSPDRHRWVLNYTYEKRDWAWGEGVGTFQGAIAGRITDREIKLWPWVFGLRVRGVALGHGRVRFQVGFESNNELTDFRGVMTARPKPVKPGESAKVEE